MALRPGLRSCLRLVSLNHPVYGLVVDPGFSRGDLTDALYQQVGRDGARDDTPDPLAVEFDSIGFAVLGILDNNLQLRRKADKLRNGIDRSGNQLVFDEHDYIGWKALDGVVKTRRSIGLCDHPDIVFEREDLLDTYPVDRLR